MDFWTLYWITRLDSTGFFLQVLLQVFFIGSLIFGCGWAVCFLDKKRDGTTFGKRTIKCIAGIIITAFLSVFIPSTQSMFAIVGGYYATNIENIEKLPPNAVKAANKFIEQYLNETTKENE